MKETPTTPERCRLLLSKWRRELHMSNREKIQLAGELISLDRQLKRLTNKSIRIGVFGRVGVGKSSLLNALLEKTCFKTDVGHGCTRNIQTTYWDQPIKKLQYIQLVDTPGIDEISAESRCRLAAKLVLQIDLILFVIDSDLNRVEFDALDTLLNSGKPILLVLNRSDQWSPTEQEVLTKSIRRRLPRRISELQLQVVAAAPRQVKLQNDGKARSYPVAPRIESLRKSLVKLLTKHGELILALNTLRQADNFSQSLKQNRLKRSKLEAQSIIGRFAAVKASGVAANPLLLLDLAGGMACDTALVIQLCNLYGLQIGGPAARQILARLSSHNFLLGGAQIGIQLVLGGIRQVLFISAPISGGLTLASAAPVAFAQAALAVYTTKVTGRLTAQELLRGKHQREVQPGDMLRRLAKSDPQVRQWLSNWPKPILNEPGQLNTLLP